MFYNVEINNWKPYKLYKFTNFKRGIDFLRKQYYYKINVHEHGTNNTDNKGGLQCCTLV